MQKRVTFWTVLLLVAALIFSGCTSRTGAGSLIETTDPDELFIELPAIVIDYASDGTASIGGLSHMVVGGTEKPGGVSLSPGARLGFATFLYALSLDTRWVQHFTATNIQHMQVNNGTDGIYLMVNGRQIPSLVWEDDSLVATADAVSALGLGLPALNRVLPLVKQLGVGIILRFPVRAGADLIPMMAEGDSPADEMAKMVQTQFLQMVGTPPTLNLPIVYHTDGSWTLGELSDIDWTVLTSTPFYALRLPAGLVASLTAAGVSTLSLQTDQDGIHIAVDDNQLPYLSWGSGEVQNVLALSKQLGLLEGISAMMPGGDVDSVLALIENLLPIIQVTNANITIYLPGSGMGN